MFHPILQRLNISIYGAGWLGNPLAYLLSQNDYQVLATQSSKISPFVHPNLRYLDWCIDAQSKPQIWHPLNEAPIQVWSIPPRARSQGEEFYLKVLSGWIANQPKNSNPKLVFLSSTSVYAPSKELITEESELVENSLIHQAEQLIINSGFDYLILRLGGLMGGDRFVGKYYSGKIVDRANGPVNYLHQEDAVQFSFSAIKNNLSGIYNLVAPEHPSRKEVVLESCKKHQLPPPISFNENEDALKIISSEKISKALQLDFLHPNPIDF